MKKLLIGLGVLLVLVAAVVVAVPFLIPMDRVRDEIVAEVKQATGRDLVIRGPVRLSVLPRVEVELNDVAFANAPGASTPQMAQLKQLKLQVELRPLLSRQIVIDSLVLVDPVVNLETDRNGRPNWHFGSAKPAGGVPPAAATPPPAAPAPGEAGRGLSDIRLGDVRLVNGTFSWFDAKSGARQQITEVNTTISLPSLDSKAQIAGNFIWNRKRVDVAAEIGTGRALLTGEATPIQAKIDTPVGKLSLAGTAKTGPTLDVAAAVDFSLTSIREAAAWVAQPIDFPNPGTLGPVAIKGKLSLVGPHMSFSDAAIALDAIRAKGDLTIDVSRARPALSGQLAVEQLDLNPYLPAEGGQAKPSGGTPPPSGVATPVQAGWSTDPIDFSALHAIDANFTLTAGGLQIRKIRIGKSALTLVMKDGRLQANLSELALYDGQANGRLMIDAGGKAPAVTAAFQLSALQAQPFLRDAFDFGRLTGKMAGDIDVHTSGASPKALIDVLAGKGKLAFTDGAFKGIDVAAMVRNVSTAFLDSGASSPRQTDFSELSGTFTIEKGVISNRDLALKAPLLRLEGSGIVDLPRRSLNYRLEPKAVASLEGQGGKDVLSGIMVPVIVEGPWNDLTYRPDLAAVLRGRALDAVKEAVPLPGGKVGPGNLLPGILGGGSGTSGGSGGSGGGAAPGLPTPLRNLFGR